MNNAIGHRRIVVGVDGSASSIAALQEAATIAAATGARIEAVSCWSVPTALAVQYALGNLDLEGGARNMLGVALTKAFGPDIPKNVSMHLIRGDARQVLPAVSDGADMLVVGRRGHGGFAGALLGSVGQACLEHAPCPVMVLGNVAASELFADGEMSEKV